MSHDFQEGRGRHPIGSRKGEGLRDEGNGAPSYRIIGQFRDHAHPQVATDHNPSHGLEDRADTLNDGQIAADQQREPPRAAAEAPPLTGASRDCHALCGGSSSDAVTECRVLRYS